jgi:hypothetical protein
MIKKVQYTSLTERESIITENANLTLIEEMNITEGNFLIFSDYQLTPTTEQQLSSEIEKVRLEQAQANAELFEMMLTLTGGAV